MCFKQERAISPVRDKPLILVDHFTYLASDITESDVNIRLAIIWKSHLSDEIKRDFFQVVWMHDMDAK